MITITKKVAFILVVVIGASAAALFVFWPHQKPLETYTVSYGDIAREISVTGKIKRGEEIDLAFTVNGKIAKIYVEKNERIKRGQILAELDSDKEKLQLASAQAALKQARYNLKKLLEGPSKEEVAVYQSRIEAAQASLEKAQKNLDDLTQVCNQSIKNKKETALTKMRSSLFYLSNAKQTVDDIQRNYFTGSDQESLSVKEKKSIVDNALTQTQETFDNCSLNDSVEKIKECLNTFDEKLQETEQAIKIIWEITQEDPYRNKISSTERANLKTQRSNIITSLTSIATAKENLLSQQLSNQKNLNEATEAVKVARKNLAENQKNLQNLIAPPTQTEIDIATSQVEQAQAQVNLLQATIKEFTLHSPVNAQVADILKQEGETAHSGETVIKLIPEAPFEISADIYEEDAAKIKVGDPVEISLVALPSKKFSGHIAFINQAQKIIDGVVYYEATIEFDEFPDINTISIMPGMSADLTIKAQQKHDVLVVPSSFIQKDNLGRYTVTLLKNGQKLNQVVEIGIDSGEKKEIIKGLTAGDILIREK